MVLQRTDKSPVLLVPHFDLTIIRATDKPLVADRNHSNRASMVRKDTLTRPALRVIHPDGRIPKSYGKMVWLITNLTEEKNFVNDLTVFTYHDPEISFPLNTVRADTASLWSWMIVACWNPHDLRRGVKIPPTFPALPAATKAWCSHASERRPWQKGDFIASWRLTTSERNPASIIGNRTSSSNWWRFSLLPSGSYEIHLKAASNTTDSSQSRIRSELNVSFTRYKD